MSWNIGKWAIEVELLAPAPTTFRDPTGTVTVYPPNPRPNAVKMPSEPSIFPFDVLENLAGRVVPLEGDESSSIDIEEGAMEFGWKAGRAGMTVFWTYGKPTPTPQHGDISDDDNWGNESPPSVFFFAAHSIEDLHAKLITGMERLGRVKNPQGDELRCIAEKEELVLDARQ